VSGHLLREAIALGARLLCPIDGAVLETESKKTPGRWGHVNKAMNQAHVIDVPTKESDSE